MADPFRFLIHGKRCDSQERLAVNNPFSGETFAEIYRPNCKQIQEAIVSSCRGFETFKRSPAHQRSELLRKTAAVIESRLDLFAKTIALEAGKPIRHARGEVKRAINTLTLSAEEAVRMRDETLPLDGTSAGQGRLGLVRRFPLGPVAGISPFNFPMNLVCHKVGPAVASGNTVLIKPASATPLSAIHLGEAFMEAGAEPGLLNTLPCASSMADALVTDDRIKMVTFTGSPEVGWGIKARAGKKRVCLELGGNAAVVIEPDADMAFALNRCVLGGYAYAGQVCISVQRIFVHQSVFDDFIDEFVQRVSRLILGDPLKEETDVGPMIDDASAARTEQWIQEAVRSGAQLLYGGGREGNRVEPAVLTHVPAGANVCAKEAFAPLTVVEPYKTFEEALTRANDSAFGLQAGVFTQDLQKAFYAYNTLDVGGVIINDVPTFRVDEMPYGGVKDSGFGREGVRYAMEEMTERKLMVIRDSL